MCTTEILYGGAGTRRPEASSPPSAMAEGVRRLKGPAAIVTGAGSGFGEGIARRFAEEGAAVVVDDIDEAGGSRVAADIAAAGGRAEFFKADVAQGDQVAALVAHALGTFGRLDVMVNNAGFPYQQVDAGCRGGRVRPHLRRQRQGHLPRGPARRARVPRARRRRVHQHRLDRGGAPAARPRLVQRLEGRGDDTHQVHGLELAPDRIRVNALNPVAGDTPLLATFMGEDTPEKRATFIATVPLGRLSTPRDIADAALFLASDESKFITGVCLEVDGRALYLRRRDAHGARACPRRAVWGAGCGCGRVSSCGSQPAGRCRTRAPRPRPPAEDLAHPRAGAVAREGREPLALGIEAEDGIGAEIAQPHRVGVVHIDGVGRGRSPGRRQLRQLPRPDRIRSVGRLSTR